jgi:putative MATE family efflux protein
MKYLPILSITFISIQIVQAFNLQSSLHPSFLTNSKVSFSNSYSRQNSFILHEHSDDTSSPISSSNATIPSPPSSPSSLLTQSNFRWKLDWEIIKIAVPAFIALAADPLASIVDAMYVARLGPVDQAAIGIAISAQYSIAKLYNDPLLKSSTSIVAGQENEALEAAVSTAVLTALFIGIIQTALFWWFPGPIMSLMGVSKANEMRSRAVLYLRWRAMGVPAATILLVVNGIFRGRGDTRTPLYWTVLGNIINIVLDPILIFGCSMGCAGAGAATAISQWITALPLLYFLHQMIPIRFWNRSWSFYQRAWNSYVAAGSLLLLRTIAKVSAYAVTSSTAARLGTVSMAAYALTFNLGFATTQLCESVSIAAQALLAREFPFQTRQKKRIAKHLIQRALVYGLVISSLLSLLTFFQQDRILHQLTASTEVFLMAKQVMPWVLLTQLIKGQAYSTGGILLGGLDWFYSTLSMGLAGIFCVIVVKLLPLSLRNIWITLAGFMFIQVIVAAIRIASNTGPWEGLRGALDKKEEDIIEDKGENISSADDIHIVK